MKLISEFIASLMAIFSMSAMTITPTPTLVPTLAKQVGWENGSISYSYYKFNEGRLELIPNYTKRDTVKNISENNQCIAGINGGFYDTENKPLGLVVVNNVQIKKNRPSPLFNGYAVVGADKTVSIEKDYQEDWLQAVQTGPVLIWEGVLATLELSRDKSARRMVFVQTNEGETYLLAIYNEPQLFEGVFLKDLPEVVEKIGKTEKWQISRAINLDGGSASAFLSPTVTLAELSPVGSFWCVKKS